jgi:hypothetical protein
MAIEVMITRDGSRAEDPVKARGFDKVQTPISVRNPNDGLFVV